MYNFADIHSWRLLRTSIVELSRLKTGRRDSSPILEVGDSDVGWVSGNVVISIGDEPVGLAGGLFGNTNDVFCGNVGLCCSGKKLTIELVGLNDKDPVGEERSEPVLILKGGLMGSVWLIGGGTIGIAVVLFACNCAW